MANPSLILAVRKGDKKALKNCIRQGADVNIPLSTRNKDTALIVAAREGLKDIIKELIASGAAIDQKNRHGRTALMAASIKGRADIVKRLISQGANVNLSDQKGDTALILAVRGGQWVVVKEILSCRVSVDQKNNDGQTALMVASSIGRKDIVLKLLSCKAVVNIQDNVGNTALIIASGSGHNATVRVLVSSGAIVNQPNHKGNSALIVAARNGFTVTVIELLSSSASVDQTNHLGRTALIEACFTGYEIAVQELISWGSNINLQDKDGNSALIVAACNGHPTIVACLLTSGAAVDLTNNEGKTALTVAREKDQFWLAQRLEEAMKAASPVQFADVSPDAQIRSDRLECSDDHERHEFGQRNGATSLDPDIYPLLKSPSYPGVTFFNEPQETVFTSSGGHVDFDNGIEVTVPPNIVPPGATVSIKVQPSFAPNDVFVLPRGVQSASPSYLVSTDLNGEMTFTMDHHVNVKTEEDADSLLFLHSDSTPRHSGEYHYKEVHEARSEFKPEESQGKLTTKNSSGFFKIGRRLKRMFSRSSTSDSLSPTSPVKEHSDLNRYSVRIYKSSPLSSSDQMALIGVSLYGRLYTKFLEQFDTDVIPRDYPQVSADAIDRTVWDSLCFVEDQLRLEVVSVSGWTVNPDKGTISKHEVDIPETENFRPEELYNYPPKIVCRFYPEAFSPERSTCTLSCTGFDTEVKVNIPLKSPTPVKSVDPSLLQEATEKLRDTASELQDQQLGSTIETFACLMEKLTIALSSTSSLEDLSLHTESIREEVQTVLRVSRELATGCYIPSIKKDIKHSLSKMETLSHQLCHVTKVKLKHCQDQHEKATALDDLVRSGATLMKVFASLLESIHTLNEVKSPPKMRPVIRPEEIAATVGTDPHLLDQPFTNDNILDFSRLIPDWLKFSIALGLTEQERNGIQTDVSLTDYGMKSYRMLEVWFKKGACSSQCHYRRLVQAALQQSTPDIKLAADICKLAQ